MVFDISEYGNTIYHNPERYDDQYWWKKNDIEFWKKIYNNISGKNILELGSGTGRLAIPLIKEGANYTGVEISEEYSKYSKKQLNQYSNSFKIITTDFRNFNFNIKSDMIFIGFNSFLHLLNDNDAMEFLKSVKTHMHEKTKFYVDIFVPNPDFLYNSHERIKKFEYIDSKTNETIYVDEICQYDSSTEIMKVFWIYYSENKQEEKYQFTMKMYYPDTMNRLITDSGLYINNLWGDYEFNEFNELSELQIYECTI